MQLTQELTRIVKKYGYLNIENKNKKDGIDNTIKRTKERIQRMDKQKQKKEIEFMEEQVKVLDKTLYVKNITLLTSTDNTKSLVCEKCRYMTDVLIVLTDKDKKRVCEKCLDLQLQDIHGKAKPENDIKDILKGNNKNAKKGK